MKKARVLVVDANPMTFDGITSTILNYAENINRDKIYIDFLSINDVCVSIKAKIIRMDAKLYTILGRNRNPINYVQKLTRLIKENRYDLVHVHGSSCTLAVEMIASKLAGVPCCTHSHSTNCEHKYANIVLRPIFDLLYKTGFACSQEAGHWLYRNREFTVINNGIESKRFMFNAVDREITRARLNIDDSSVIILQIGYFSKVKNHEFSLSLLRNINKKVPNKYKMIFAGEGDLQNDIKNRAALQGIDDRTMFLGAVEYIPQLLSASDIMILPSLYEGFPFTAIESQANGIKCVFSSNVTRRVRMGDEIEFENLDINKWTDIILNTDTYDSYQRELRSKKAISEIMKLGYDINNNAKKLEELYLLYSKK